MKREGLDKIGRFLHINIATLKYDSVDFFLYELYVNLIHKQQQTFSPRIMYRKANPTLCNPVFFSMIFRQFQANNCQNSELEENFG